MQSTAMTRKFNAIGRCETNNYYKGDNWYNNMSSCPMWIIQQNKFQASLQPSRLCYAKIWGSVCECLNYRLGYYRLAYQALYQQSEILLLCFWCVLGRLCYCAIVFFCLECINPQSFSLLVWTLFTSFACVTTLPNEAAQSIINKHSQETDETFRTCSSLHVNKQGCQYHKYASLLWRNWSMLWISKKIN